MKILFLQTVHTKDDDRVRYHQRMSLERAGHTCDFASRIDNRSVAGVDVVICDTPRAVYYARRGFGQRASIVYDITEWYPSKKNLRYTSAWLRPFKFCTLVIANLWAGIAADRFLFGEFYKAKPFRLLFPWKRHLYLPYYPSLQYLPFTAPSAFTDEVRLFYAGPQTQEKGYRRVEQLADLCRALLPDKTIRLTCLKGVPYEQFCSELSRQDICLDLRDADFENTRCLPIKLFYYMASGKAFLYSRLKAIEQGVPEVKEWLVEPDDLSQAASMIAEWVSHPERYQAVCARNRQLAEERYNWERLEKAFVEFIEQA